MEKMCEFELQNIKAIAKQASLKNPLLNCRYEKR